MIERPIDSPMPIPVGLVVKKALNSRSAFSAEIPTPQSFTVSSTWCSPSRRDRIGTHSRHARDDAGGADRNVGPFGQRADTLDDLACAIAVIDNPLDRAARRVQVGSSVVEPTETG